MSELIIELFCEEIPARMQAKAEADLGGALQKALKEAGLSWDGFDTASGPRRLAVFVEGLSKRSEDVREERKGPKVGAPEKAVQGFLRGAGLDSIDQAEVRSDPKKGEFYVAIIETPGRPASQIVAEAMPEIIRGFHWPKSMRWGTGELRWVRPLQRITCVLEGEVVPFEVDGLASSNEVEGHRIHGRGPYKIVDRKDYQHSLEQVGHVLLTRDARRKVILEGIERVCAEAGLDWVDDKGLLEEVVGLAEWPVVILGDMDPDFLSLPPEVITLSMRTHQKYFAVTDKKTGKLAPSFIVVANIAPTDGGAKIAEGNAKVLSARLEDARFFWDKDKAISLDEMGARLSTIAFKEELGSLGDKVERVAALARELAPNVGADPDLAERAARLAKADLVSEMVGEFPELQGVMGRYYALEAGEPEAVADAIRDHYKPQGPSEPVPTDPVSIAVALADKLDTLVGFWAIGEKPTGSKDPFALRRAALGSTRILLRSGKALGLKQVLDRAAKRTVFDLCLKGRVIAIRPDEREARHHRDVRFVQFSEDTGGAAWSDKLPVPFESFARECQNWSFYFSDDPQLGASFPEGWKPLPGFGFDDPVNGFNSLAKDLLSFFADRLKQHLRDEGQRHDLIDAVFALGEDDLVLITRRVEALGSFLDTEDGANLLVLYKRAVNILEKSAPLPAQGARSGKGETSESPAQAGAALDMKLIAKGPAEEQALAKALSDVRAAIEAPMQAEDFAGVMAELAKLRGPVDAFFEAVMVNDEDPKVRANRLALLTEIRETLHRVANFSKIEG